MVSGFLITGILLDSLDDPHYFRNFYVRRALRIFPLYYGFLVLWTLILPHFFSMETLDLLPGRKLEYFLYYANYAMVFIGWPPLALGVF